MITINNEILKTSHYPDGTLNIKGIPHTKETVFISWMYENNEEYMVLAFITKYLQARRCKVYLFMPYVPNGRMDRAKNIDDIITIKYFGELINNLNFESVIVLDVHSSVTPACFKKLTFFKADKFIDEVINAVSNTSCFSSKPPVLFYPDEGSMKRYSDTFKLPYAFGIKNRDWQTGEIKGLTVIDEGNKIKGNDVLIIDDICSKGGTFYHSAKKLKELGARNIYLYVTHCENTILKGDLINSGLITHIFTTDSIFSEKDKSISVCKLKLKIVHNDTEMEFALDGEWNI